MKADEVVHYLQNNPQFFEEHAEVLTSMVVPHPHGGRTISITERQMLALRDKNRLLEGRMGELFQHGEENDAISEKMHRLALGLIATGSFQSVLHTLHFHLRDDFAVPHVAVRLWCRPADAAELPEFADVSSELQAFAEALVQPYCGATGGFETSSWFGEAATHVRSQALIAMRQGGGTTGMIALGSEDHERFYPTMGTIYLQRIGEMASAALARVLR
ncbi:MAG: DUF484 family protein [Candidatus Accumulibacter sp.]|uniref:DUF484 family protein n=2 Tax=Accumulibacter sp. TaxID=2053492 RepID=UPI00287ABC0B|nr:DUF484 family protein [Accumulibacter sp.]MDS4015065.1 DUF484 family protein [Accumulibacter sp.]